MSRAVAGWRVRSLLIGIALISLLLAGGVHLRRRYAWYRHMTRVHGLEADRLEGSITLDAPLSEAEVLSRFRRSHWHGYVSSLYGEAACRPWMSFQADPSDPYCMCKYCRAKPWLPPELLRVPESAGKAP